MLSRLFYSLIICCALGTLSLSFLEENRWETNFSNESEDENVYGHPLVEEDFTIDIGTENIKLGCNYEELKIKEEMKKFRPETENHPYQLYVYEDFVLTVVPIEKSKSQVIQITITSPSIQTFRGIKVGDKLSQVFEKYFTQPENRYGSYSYSNDMEIISFQMDENKNVSTIILELF